MPFTVPPRKSPLEARSPRANNSSGSNGRSQSQWGNQGNSNTMYCGAAGLKCRSQVTDQVTGYRPQATGQVTGHRSQSTDQVTGHTKNNSTLDKTVLD